MPSITVLPYSGKSSKSMGRSGNTDSLSKVPDSIIHETTTINKTLPFRFSQRVAEVFVLELTKATFGHVAQARKIEICRSALGSALRVC